MWVLKMKKLLSGFNSKALVIALTVSGLAAGLLAWFTRANFWYAFLIVLCAMLVNGWIASFEDHDREESEK